MLTYICIWTGAAASGSGDSEKKEKAQKGGTAVKVNICILYLHKNILLTNNVDFNWIYVYSFAWCIKTENWL